MTYVQFPGFSNLGLTVVGTATASNKDKNECSVQSQRANADAEEIRVFLNSNVEWSRHGALLRSRQVDDDWVTEMVCPSLHRKAVLDYLSRSGVT